METTPKNEDTSAINIIAHIGSIQDLSARFICLLQSLFL